MNSKDIVPGFIALIGRLSDRRNVIHISQTGYFILPHGVSIEPLREGRNNFSVSCRSYRKGQRHTAVKVNDTKGLIKAIRDFTETLDKEGVLLTIPIRRSWWYSPVLGPDVDGRYQVRVPKSLTDTYLTKTSSRIHVGYAVSEMQHNRLRHEAGLIHENLKMSICRQFGITVDEACKVYRKNPMTSKRKKG